MSRDLAMKFTPASKGDTYDKMSSCVHCRKDPTDKPFPICAACKEASFCSKECQTKAWPLHKMYCQMRKNTVARMVNAPSSDTFPPFFIRKRLLTDFIEVHECLFQNAFISAITLAGGLDNFAYSKRAMLILLQYRPDCNENPSVAFSVLGCMWLDDSNISALDKHLETTLRTGREGYCGTLRVHFRMEDHVVGESYPEAHVLGPIGFLYRKHLKTFDHSKWLDRVQRFVKDGLVMRAQGETTLNMLLGTLKMRKGKWVWVQLSKTELVAHGYPPDFSGLLF
ncbi:MYND-type domain-containing protein [Favolaschia claudopus]|uniref:MYND-type domain-containing protein n=1 Tax=Favolaschia claudopus TaxID=2862362 RepID=A0AAW0AZ05_9AGAR